VFHHLPAGAGATSPTTASARLSHAIVRIGARRPDHAYLSSKDLTYSRGVPEFAAAELTDEERAFLARGLREWGGPAAPTDDVARLLGFESVRALYDEGGVIASRIRSCEPLTPADWRRALLATELVFASDLIGSGVDWPTTTGFTDEESIRLLRSVQRKLASIARRA
jgi:hypothetical protein